MRLTTVILILSMMQVSAVSMAQKVTYNKKGVSLSQLFKEIKKQTGYSVLWSARKVKTSATLDVNFKETPLNEVLDKSLANQPLTYEIDEKTIIIKEKKASVVDRIIEYFSVIDVRGKVVDEQGEPLQGATVKVMGGTLGTMTGKDGEFFLKGVPEDAVIVIAYLGYKPLELKVVASMGMIKMELATSELEEVTVSTGYWTTTKRLSTGNIAKVTAKEIGNQPITSPLLALQGRVAGLEITMPANAVPGVAPKIRIRGNNSLRMENKGTASNGEDGNYPLYVIDGVPVNSSPILGVLSSSLAVGGYDPLSTIAPENIESIEILKDADATAIYGSRGANGVILITTKHNSKNVDQTNIDFKIYKGHGRVVNRLNLLNTSQYLAMRQEGLANEGVIANVSDYDLKYWDIKRYTDWQEMLIGGTAGITDVQGNISFGNSNTKIRIGGGFHKESMVFPGNSYYQLGSGQSSINHTSSNQRFKVNVNINYGINNHMLFADGGQMMNAALTLPPHAPNVYKDDGSLNWEVHNINGENISTWFNPIASLESAQNALTRNLVTSSTVSYNILSNLIISTSTGYTELAGEETITVPTTASRPEEKLLGLSSFKKTSRGSWIIEPKLSYSKKIKGHSVDMIVGATWQKSTSSYDIISARNYSSDNLLNSLKAAGFINVVDESFYEYKYTSIYGRVGYNWRNKYLVNITGRRDGSSRFGPNRQFGNFGAIGAGWVFSEERTFENVVRILNFGKIRGSYGITGSDAASDYKYYNLFSVLSDSYDGVRGYIPSSLYNPDFAWAVTKKAEFALELGFLNSRIGIELAWYRNRSSNQLVDYTLPATTGFPSVLSNFDATVQNTGWEGALRVEPISSEDLRWNVSFNLSIPRNKLVRFEGIENSPYANKFKIGEPLTIQFLLKWKGLNAETGLHEFVDKNGDGIINRLDMHLINSRDRAYYGGINNSFHFKGFELAVQLQYTKQFSDRFLPSKAPGFRSTNQPIEVLNRWYMNGDRTHIQRFTVSSVNDAAYLSYINAIESDYNNENASFIRIKTVSLSYALMSNLVKKIGFQQTNLFLQGQNLLTLTRYTGLDPETGSGLPPLRMVTAGIQVGL